MTQTAHSPSSALATIGDDAPALPANGAPPRTPRDRQITPQALNDMLAARRKRSDGWTPINVVCFLEVLADGGSVKEAVDYVGLSVAAAYKLRNHPQGQAFREAWDAAVAPRFGELCDLAMERVRNGVEKKRWWRDAVVGADIVYNDRLLIHMLRLYNPDRSSAAAAAPSGEMRTVAPREAPAILPLGADYIVAAAVEIGKLGWNPDDDMPTELRHDDETEAAAAKMLADKAAREADYLAKRTRIDAMLHPELFAPVDGDATPQRLPAGDDRFAAEDAAWQREYDWLSNASTSSTSGRSRG